VSVTVEQRLAERVVVVEGDLACPATLVQLHATLSQVGIFDVMPVVVDLSAATGTAPGVRRLLNRTARLMSHRGIAFQIVAPELASV
jgi:hypothetical protein